MHATAPTCLVHSMACAVARRGVWQCNLGMFRFSRGLRDIVIGSSACRHSASGLQSLTPMRAPHKPHTPSLPLRHPQPRRPRPHPPLQPVQPPVLLPPQPLWVHTVLGATALHVRGRPRATHRRALRPWPTNSAPSNKRRTTRVLPLRPRHAWRIRRAHPPRGATTIRPRPGCLTIRRCVGSGGSTRHEGGLRRPPPGQRDERRCPAGRKTRSRLPWRPQR